MDKIDLLLKTANERLKQSNAGIKIFKRGQKLSLRGMLPVKKGDGKKREEALRGSDAGKPFLPLSLLSKKQQIISLGVYCNAAGIQSAEKKAQKLASQLALKEFTWDEWSSDRNNNIGSIGYWVDKFEFDYYSRKSRNSKTESTWHNDYQAMSRFLCEASHKKADRMFARVDNEDRLGENKLIELILTTEPDTRTRQRAVMASNALAAFAGLKCDFNRYKGNYSHLSGDRELPTDKQIVQYYQSISNPHWQRAFGLMAAYGISNHELFYVDLDSLRKPPGHLVSIYRKNHYGIRRIWCLYPEWFEQWQLYKPISLPNISGKNNKDLGHRVSTQFRRYELCKPGDLRHCWAIRAMGFMPDAMAARMMAHTTQVHNDTYKRWMNEDQEQKFYQLLMQRNDRPKPPANAEE